jgi:hypothetical protein
VTPEWGCFFRVAASLLPLFLPPCFLFLPYSDINDFRMSSQTQCQRESSVLVQVSHWIKIQQAVLSATSVC